jgi:hypothetical protein
MSAVGQLSKHVRVSSDTVALVKRELAKRGHDLSGLGQTNGVTALLENTHEAEQRFGGSWGKAAITPLVSKGLGGVVL